MHFSMGMSVSIDHRSILHNQSTHTTGSRVQSQQHAVSKPASKPETYASINTQLGSATVLSFRLDSPTSNHIRSDGPPRFPIRCSGCIRSPPGVAENTLRNTNKTNRSTCTPSPHQCNRRMCLRSTRGMSIFCRSCTPFLSSTRYRMNFD